MWIRSASKSASYVGRLAPPGIPNTCSTPSALSASHRASAARMANDCTAETQSVSAGTGQAAEGRRKLFVRPRHKVSRQGQVRRPKVSRPWLGDLFRELAQDREIQSRAAGADVVLGAAVQVVASPRAGHDVPAATGGPAPCCGTVVAVEA